MIVRFNLSSPNNERTMNYYTPSEFSKLIKCHKATVYRLIKQKKLEVVRIGGLVRIPESVLALGSLKSLSESKRSESPTFKKEDSLWE